MERQPSQHIRRVLFDSDHATDNATNQLREIFDQDEKTMIEKYNFDPKLETPLKGQWVWYKGGRYDWVGIKAELDVEIDEDKLPAAATPQNSVEVNVSTPKKKTENSDRPNGIEVVKKVLDM